MAYSNVFAWVIILNKLLASPDIDVNEINQVQTLDSKIEKISEQFQIDDVILNTNQNPYLSNFVKQAMDHQEKTHYIIYHPYINTKSISHWTRLTSHLNENKKLPLLEQVSQLLADFYDIGKRKDVKVFAKNLETMFVKFEDDLNKALIDKGYRPNIKFINIHESIKVVQDLYRQEHVNDQKQCEDFNKKIEEKILHLYDRGLLSDQPLPDRSNAIDILKLLGVLSVKNQ